MVQCLVLVALYVTLVGCYVSDVDAFLYENGTCSNEKVKEISKQVINTNGTVDDFLETLPSDNTVLAQIICNDSSYNK